MPAVTLKGHTCTGHGCFPPRVSVAGQARFTVGKVPVHVKGDAWATHCCTAPPHPCHAGALAAGSPRFTVAGQPIGRVGDPVDCGSQVAEGVASFTVA